MSSSQTVVLTFGTFDIFHYGHLRILQRAAQLGTKLIVGVSSDKLNFCKKNTIPTICEDHRMEIIRALRCVHDVFLEESLELKGTYLTKYKADVLVMGHDWTGKFDQFKESHDIDVVYLPRTPNVSSTLLKDKIKHT